MLVFDFFNPFSQEQGNSNLTLRFNPVELSASCTLNLTKNDYQAANRDKNISLLNPRGIKDPNQNPTFITLDFEFSLKTIRLFFANLERLYNHLIPPNQLRFFEQDNFHRCTLQEAIELIIFTIKSKTVLHTCVIPPEFTEACNQSLSGKKKQQPIEPPPKKVSTIHVLFFNSGPFPLQLSPPASAAAAATPIQKTGQVTTNPESSTPVRSRDSDCDSTISASLSPRSSCSSVSSSRSRSRSRSSSTESIASSRLSSQSSSLSPSTTVSTSPNPASISGGLLARRSRPASIFREIGILRGTFSAPPPRTRAHVETLGMKPGLGKQVGR